MKYVKELDKKTIEELKELVKSGETLQIRQRAHAILLSNEGMTIKEICKIFNKSIRTIYRWFNRFKEAKTEKLADEVGRGRKAALNEKDIEKVKKLISKSHLQIIKNNSNLS